MTPFCGNYLSRLTLPLGSVWLMSDVAEAKGRQDLLPWLNFFLTILKRAYRELDKLPA